MPARSLLQAVLAAATLASAPQLKPTDDQARPLSPRLAVPGLRRLRDQPRQLGRAAARLEGSAAAIPSVATDAPRHTQAPDSPHTSVDRTAEPATPSETDALPSQELGTDTSDSGSSVSAVQTATPNDMQSEPATVITSNQISSSAQVSRAVDDDAPTGTAAAPTTTTTLPLPTTIPAATAANDTLPAAAAAPAPAAPAPPTSEWPQCKTAIGAVGRHSIDVILRSRKLLQRNVGAASNFGEVVAKADRLTHAKLAHFDTRAPGTTFIVPRNLVNASTDSAERVSLFEQAGLRPAQMSEAEATQVAKAHMIPETVTLADVTRQIAATGEARYPSLAGVFWTFKLNPAGRPALVDPRPDAPSPFLYTLPDVSIAAPGTCPNMVIIIEGFVVTPATLPALTVSTAPQAPAPPAAAPAPVAAPAAAPVMYIDINTTTETESSVAESPGPELQFQMAGLQSNSGGSCTWEGQTALGVTLLALAGGLALA